MFNLALVFLFSLILTLISLKFLIFFLKRRKIGQPILSYVEKHEKKNGTPTMAGLCFILPIVLTYFLFCKGEKSIALFAVIIFLAFAVVGFLDDFIKVRFNKNEGLSVTQKLLFQIAISALSGIFIYRMGVSVAYLPFSKKTVNLGVFYSVLSAVVFLATTNCVNLVDGLDSLAGSVCQIYFVFSALLIGLQITVFHQNYYSLQDYSNLITILIALVGSLSGFLAFNSPRASIFMGDTGSLALGGLVGFSLCISGNVFYIPIIGIVFVITGLSVIIQVAHFKRTKKRVFLMSPIHHHFELKGYSESKITYIYKLITIVFGLISILFLLRSVDVL